VGRWLRFFVDAVPRRGTATSCPGWRAICGMCGCCPCRADRYIDAVYAHHPCRHHYGPTRHRRFTRYRHNSPAQCTRLASGLAASHSRPRELAHRESVMNSTVSSDDDIIDSGLTKPEIRHHHGHVSHLHANGDERHDHGPGIPASGWNPGRVEFSCRLARSFSLSILVFSVAMYALTFQEPGECRNASTRPGNSCQTIATWHTASTWGSTTSLVLMIASLITLRTICSGLPRLPAR